MFDEVAGDADMDGEEAWPALSSCSDLWKLKVQVPDVREREFPNLVNELEKLKNFGGKAISLDLKHHVYERLCPQLLGLLTAPVSLDPRHCAEESLKELRF